MWISKNTYNSYIKAMEKSNARITSLNEENRYLFNEVRRLNRLLADNDIEDVDFPNSKKGGFEGSNIFLM